MGKITLDRSGKLLQQAFYRFDVPFEDAPFGGPAPGSIVALRTPTSDALALAAIKDHDKAYMWVELVGGGKNCVETRDCPVDKEHVTHRYYTNQRAEGHGGKRLSPFIPSSVGFTFVVCDDLRRRIEATKARGTRIDPLIMTRGDDGPIIDGYWTLQFTGKAKQRLPQFKGVPNACPHCGKTKIICDACGHWSAYCKTCEKQMVIIESKHDGANDKRVPFEDASAILEGTTWDGSDLVQAGFRNFASKRFIDWLLRIHAAPFYAEPVDFCVDGMSDQQKKWFDELQKPFEF